MRAFSALPEQLNLIMPVSAGFDSAEDEVTHLGFKVQRKLFKWKDFENHLERSCKLIRATDPALSFSVFLSLDHDGPFIFENHLPRFVDLNFDVLQGCQVGPNNWCLEERESDMEAARMLMILGKSGVIDLLRFTPETLPALWCDYLVRKDDLTPPPAKSWTKLLEKLMSYERDLLARSPKAREAWHTPMARLAKHWQILNESFHRSNEDTYGLVF